MKPILIIEDEKDIVDLIAYHLGQSGFSVISALDGPSGLERAKKERPGLVRQGRMRLGKAWFGGVMHGAAR